MNEVDINQILSITSTILSVLSIWLALHFYNKTKDAEVSVNKILENIKTQTSLVQRMTGRWMDKLIDRSYDSQPVTETISILAGVIQSRSLTPQLELPRPQQQEELETQKTQAIFGYIGIYYYSGLTNLAMQELLPQEIDENDEGHVAKRNVLNFSYDDFYTFKNVLSQYDLHVLENNRGSSLYKLAEEWVPLIKNYDQIQTEKQSS